MYGQFLSKVAVVQEGEEQLPRCELCVIHMPVVRLIRHQRTAHCDKNTHMRWRRRDVTIADSCLKVTFSLTGEEEAEYI